MPPVRRHNTEKTLLAAITPRTPKVGFQFSELNDDVLDTFCFPSSTDLQFTSMNNAFKIISAMCHFRCNGGDVRNGGIQKSSRIDALYAYSHIFKEFMMKKTKGLDGGKKFSDFVSTKTERDILKNIYNIFFQCLTFESLENTESSLVESSGMSFDSFVKSMNEEKKDFLALF